MISIDWQAVGAGYPDGFHDEDELLVILTSSKNKDLPAWVEQLESEKLAVLEQRCEYLVAHCGLHGETRKPFTIIKWSNVHDNPLERRLILSKLIRKVRAQFEAVQSIKVILPGSKVDLEMIVMAEDINTYFAGHSFQDRKLKSLSTAVESLELIKQSDKQQETRFNHNLAYRYWINENPDERTSIKIGQDLETFARKHNCDFTALDEKELSEKGLNLLVAVGAASSLSPSRLFIVTHNVSDNSKPLLLVGKGITFDTGGINVKPYESYVNCMRNDMGGSALMAQLFMALVEAGYDEPLALAIPACENLVAEKAMKPGAIYQSHRGHSVVVDHTDAEGRLILADAISYAESLLSPNCIMTAATLTTAALRQFTGYQTPVYFAPKSFHQALDQQAQNYGEAFLYFDRFLPFRWANRGKFSDLTNMGRLPAQANIGGGSNIAAHFLAEFCDAPFIHFDIFASTWNWSGDYPGSTGGATGAAFNSLFACLMENRQAQLFNRI